jgi:enoyl-CoA hydratase/carnithine racemase
VVDAGEAHAVATALAADLARKSPLVLSMTKRHVNAIAEQMGSTSLSFLDADALGAAQRDPASRAAARAYLDRR